MGENTPGAHEPSGTRKAGVALQVTMWLALLWFLGGLAYTIAGPAPEPTKAVTGLLFPDVELADVYKIRVFDPDGGFEFSRTSHAVPWVVKTLAWSEESTYDAVLRLETVPYTLDEDLLNGFLERLLKSQSRKVHETDVSQALIEKTIPDGPRFVLTDKAGRELGHFVVGSRSRQNGATFLIVFPAEGGDGVMHEVSTMHRSDFKVNRFVALTGTEDLGAEQEEQTLQDTAPRISGSGLTSSEESIARVSESGLKIVTLKTGTGPEVTATDGVVVTYSGWLENGRVFDSSVDPKFGHPEPFVLSNLNTVIPGWREGLIGMQAGEIRKLWIPFQLAYGESGQPPLIPPKAALIFEIELLEITTRG